MLAKPLLLDQKWISKVTSLCVAVQAGTDAMRADSKLEKALKLELVDCGSRFLVQGAVTQGSASKGSVFLSCKQQPWLLLDTRAAEVGTGALGAGWKLDLTEWTWLELEPFTGAGSRGWSTST